MTASDDLPFSWRWTFTSMVIFMLVELGLGGLVGQYLLGRYMSISLSFTLQGLLHVVSFFIGGVLVGVMSPGVRILEPAVGAALTVAMMLLLTVFTPYTFMAMQSHKLLLGSLIAFVVALTGAKLGERFTGNRV